jgi:hypothetical protein
MSSHSNQPRLSVVTGKQAHVARIEDNMSKDRNNRTAAETAAVAEYAAAQTASAAAVAAVAATPSPVSPAAVVRRHENAAAAVTGGAVSNPAATVTTAEQDRAFQTVKGKLKSMAFADDSDDDCERIGMTLTRTLVKAALSMLDRDDKPTTQSGKIRAGADGAENVLAAVTEHVRANVQTVLAAMRRPGDTLPERLIVSEYVGIVLGVKEVTKELRQRVQDAANKM